MATIAYQLEQLFLDQDPDLVVDTVPAVLAWVPGMLAATSLPMGFRVERTPGAAAGKAFDVDLTWSLAALEARDPTVLARASRMSTRRTAQREHVAQLAAYGLAFVAISIWMPGARVRAFTPHAAPDLLLDETPGALVGVEVAGRSTGGLSALRAIRDGRPATGKRAATVGKRAQLLARADVATAHLSLWCATPRVGLLERVKP